MFGKPSMNKTEDQKTGLFDGNCESSKKQKDSEQQDPWGIFSNEESSLEETKPS